MTRWALFLIGSAVYSQCLNFPAGVIPFSTISYVTAANSSGDQLVVGALAGGLNTLAALPLPDTTNELYCDSSVQLAPGQYYTSVYVPSAAERSGNFSAFAGLLVNPANNQPYPGGMIPSNQLGQIFAFRIAPVQAARGVRQWSPTGSISFPTTNAPAVILPNGKVMTIEGSVVEIYDPATGLFIRGGNTLFNHGQSVTATLLKDGRVLLAGGGGAPKQAEFYDPATQKFTAIAATMNEEHGFTHTADILPDGRVLIVGGLIGQETVPINATDTGAEIFDPKTLTFTAVPTLAAKRRRHTSTQLADGRVLIIGGTESFSAGNSVISLVEVFNPATGQFSVAGSTLLGHASHASLLLPDGQVLIAGGFGAFNAAELFDPVKGQSIATGSMTQVREQLSAVLLSNGQALIIGGSTQTATGVQALSSVELYNPATGIFAPVGSMTAARAAFPAVVLLDGRVLVAGGLSNLVLSNNTITASTAINSAEIYTPVTQGLVTSQTGLTFRAAQSSTSVPSQTLAVLSPTDDIPWTVSVKTYSGGNWLSASPSSSESKPGAAPVTLTVNVDPTGLAPQDYYGAVTLTPTDQKHPPVTVAVVFSIVPAGAQAPLQVAPTGLVYLTQTGSSPAAQTFKATNFTNRAVNFSATSTSTFFTFAPQSGTITTAIPGSITVTPSTTNLTAGVYRGNIKLAFSDGSSQTVDVLMVVSAAPAAPAHLRGAAAACTPTKLLPVLTSVASGQTAPVAWPQPVLAQIVDDCGNPINSGNVIASFTNGDPPLPLINVSPGQWSATWVPVHTSANTTVRLDARLLQPALSGTVQAPVQVAANPKVPVVAAGGVLSAGDYASPPAAGLHVAIFGSALADGTAQFMQAPLPTELGSTQVLLGGNPLPLVFVSENQVNVLVPYETPLNAPLPLVVQRANAISVPVQVAVFDAQPAILATAGNGQGQGHIYRALSSGAQVLADKNSPAAAGDVLVMYTVGLGATSPAVPSGSASPSSPLAQVPVPVTVTIGGQTSTPIFAGLAPGFVGLYQVNVQMPAGVASGPAVPVSLSVGAKSSPPGITMAAQ